MIEFDHVAITVENLERAIQFYKILGYQLQYQFQDKEYHWATLQLGKSSLELFKPLSKTLSKIEHLAYSYTNKEEVFELLRNLDITIDRDKIFYGNLNRESFFLENNDIPIQFIKK